MTLEIIKWLQFHSESHSHGCGPDLFAPLSPVFESIVSEMPQTLSNVLSDQSMESKCKEIKINKK